MQPPPVHGILSHPDDKKVQNKKKHKKIKGNSLNFNIICFHEKGVGVLRRLR